MAGGEPKESQTHLHAPDARLKARAAILDTLKNKAKTERASARELVLEACGSADDPTVAALPSLHNMRRTAARIQNRSNVNMNPKTLAELVFDDDVVMTSRNKHFLLHDSAVYGEDPEPENRLLLFGTKENLDILKVCDTIAMDGTFKIVPPLFKQLFTMHGTFFVQFGCFFLIFSRFFFNFFVIS